MRKFTKQKVTIIQGVIGDMTLDQIGWLSQEEQDKFQDNHTKHVEELKRTGQYLKPMEVEVNMEHDDLYDSPKVPNTKGIESYRMTILDLSKYGRITRNTLRDI